MMVRTRPTSSFASGNLTIDIPNHSIGVHMDKEGGPIANNKLEQWTFKMSRVLHNAAQDYVYDHACRDIVDSVIDGLNGTVLAYGQTGAGKTYTMSGGEEYVQRGIIPRAIGHIFKRIGEHPETTTVVRLSYLEIYNEAFFDLLNPESTAELSVRETGDSNGVVHVRGLKLVEAHTEEEALNYLFEGQHERAMAAHKLNRNSTRSHCILTLHLETRSNIESSEKVIVSKLNLVDLAGSERVGKTNSTGMLLNEAKSINKSLTFLEQVIIALASKSRDHVPFRQSKLTNVLRDSLGGNCKTRMIANIWAEKEQLEETISTLKFGTRMMRLANNAQVNVKHDPEMLLKKYEKEIRELRQELAMHDTLSNRSNVTYDSYTPEQQAACRGEVKAYIDAGTEIEICSLRQIREVFFQFKNIVLDLRVSGGSLSNRGERDASGNTDAMQADAGGNGSNGFDDAYVGNIDQDAGGFHLGQAPDQSRPTGLDAMDITLSSLTSKDPDDNKKMSPRAPVPVKRVVKPHLNETAAFDEFKCNEGSSLQNEFQGKKDETLVKKRELKNVSIEVNRLKKEIDELDATIQSKRKSRASGGAEDIEVIDEEEYALIKQLRDKKKDYNAQFNARKSLNAELANLKNFVEQSKMDLCNKFLEWYKATYHIENGNGDEEEVLDDGEQFDKMERERVMTTDPDSISYYNAQKKNTKRQGGGKQRK